MKMMSKKRWKLIPLIYKIEEKILKLGIIRIKIFHNNPHLTQIPKKNNKKSLRFLHYKINCSKNQKINKKKLKPQ